MRSVFDLITLTAAVSVRAASPSSCHWSKHLFSTRDYSDKLWPAKTEGFGYQGEQDNSNNCMSNLAPCLLSGCNRSRGDNVREHNGTMIRELLFFMLIGHLRCGLGSTGLLKEESDTVKENLTSPWHSEAIPSDFWPHASGESMEPTGSCLCCQRAFRDGPLNLYWYCQFSLSSVWYAQKPQRGWIGWSNRALAFHKENYKHWIHYHACIIQPFSLCKQRLLIVVFLNKRFSLMITSSLIMSSSESVLETIVVNYCKLKSNFKAKKTKKLKQKKTKTLICHWPITTDMQSEFPAKKDTSRLDNIQSFAGMFLSFCPQVKL